MSTIALDHPIQHAGKPISMALRCDDCGGVVLVTETRIDDADAVRDARSMLAAAGWTCDHDADKDTCSDCAGNPLAKGSDQ